MATYSYPTSDFQTTTLSGALNAGATTATIGTGLNIPAANGVLQVDYDSTETIGTANSPETISYTSYNSGTGALSGIVRGLANTQDVDHGNTAPVQCGVSALMITDLVADVSAVSTGSEWLSAGETWVYASASTVTVSGDQTGKYQKGDKVKLTQSATVKYFVIDITPTYSAPDTTLTLRSYVSTTSVANEAITNNYYSRSETPFGFPKEPRARAYLNATLGTTVDSAATKVALDAETYDIGANFASNKFVAPCGGYYSISAAIQYGSVASDRQFGIYIYKNGSAIANVMNPNGSSTPVNVTATISDTVFLAATDYLELYYYHTSGTTADIVGGTTVTYLAVNYLGK